MSQGLHLAAQPLQGGQSTQDVSSGHSRSPLPLQKQQILLIHGNCEQSRDIATLLSVRLKYEVRGVLCGQEAVGALQAEIILPDAIMIDISSIKNADRTITDILALKRHIPIIVLVAYGDYQQAAESLVLGAHDFITKPFAEERLGVTLRNAIALFNAKKEATSALRLANMGQARQFLQPQPDASVSETIISLVSPTGEVRKMQEIEKKAICFAVKFYNGRMSEVARKLGIGRSTLYRKLEAIGKI